MSIIVYNNLVFNTPTGLPTQAVALLQKTSGVDLTMATSTPIYTVPAGQHLILTEVVVVAATVNTVLVTPSLSVGITPLFTDWMGGLGIAGLSVVGDFIPLSQNALLPFRNIFNPGDVVSLNVTGAATATALTVDVYALGILY